MNIIPIYQLQPVTAQSARMYQQTYLDRTRVVTDTFVQEQVSQSAWTMAAPTPTVFIPTNATIVPAQATCVQGSNPSQQYQYPGSYMGHMAYLAMPGVQYYAASSASMNAYGQAQIYSTRASASTTCNFGGYGAPPYYGHNPPKQFSATQTQTVAPLKRSCDVGTQVDMAMEELCAKDPDPGSSDKSDDSMDSAAGDGMGLQKVRRNSEVTLLQQRLTDITRISLYGSEIAERLASAHRNRPCFKKIDTLCARLKQDLLRPDGVLPNINSQGIAWAVKDFIFVFTRIVNAWVILKGYVYNTPDGLNKIKDELPSGFMSTFDSWQCGTLAMLQMIIKSYVSLDELLQKQKNCFVGKDSSGTISLNSSNTSASLRSTSECNESGTMCHKALGSASNGNSVSQTPSEGQGSPNGSPRNESDTDNGKSLCEGPETEQSSTSSTSTALNKPKSGMNLSYLYTMIEDSEETQRHVDANGTYLKTGTYQPLQKDANQLEMPPPMAGENQTHLQLNGRAQGKLLTGLELLPSSATGETECQFNGLSLGGQLSLVDRELTRQLFEFSDRVMELQHVERFFQKQFTRNYYPDFYHRCQDEYIDIRAIILQCESSSYNHLNQAIHDLRRIIFVGRCYLQIYTNDNLQHYIDLYEHSLNEMLSKPPHVPNQYDHILGKPGEKLFVY
ncbi:protein mitoshell isoform X2 [Drosophila bipectinata]|uniref:protein mitoshell isoform X2 n=1 Tax=Drosophila bipectinata TaxID=42026 RepID=UPI0038B40FF4